MTNVKFSRRTILLYSTLLPVFLWRDAARASEPGESQAKWNQLTPEQQELVRKRWAEFKAMPRERRDQLRASMRRFAALDKATQQRIRENWKSWNAMPSNQKDEIRRNYSRFQGMSAERRAALSEKYKQWKKQNDENRKRK